MAAGPAGPAADGTPCAVYQQLREFATDLVAASATKAPVDPARLDTLCSAVIAALRTQPYRLLALQSECPDTGTAAHMANTAVIAAYLGAQMRLDEAGLKLLCAAALFHDIAMPQFEILVNVPRHLSSGDLAQVKRHVQLGMELTDKLLAADASVAAGVKDLCRFAHERADGRGYPQGLKGDQIPMSGQILGLADAYEAMTHPRPWREPLLPHTATLQLIQQNEPLFERDLVRCFVESLTMFPPACHVELASGKTAYVIAVNKDYSTRPKVCLLNAKGEPTSVVDLRSSGMHIARQIPRPVGAVSIAQMDWNFWQPGPRPRGF
jgi:HD-GYP domain-containing protein (c-di-GMP phosphodiesterase class II)